MFVKRFASATEKIMIADLALDKRKREESVTKYITRWRNLSMKCEQQFEEEHAVQLLMGNIDDKMQPFMCMATITTFQDLLDRVAKFEKLNLSNSESHLDKPKKTKFSDAKKGEIYSTSSLRSSKGKQVVYNVDKGKQPMQYEEKPKQVYNPNPQPKLILGGNDKPRNFQGEGERPRQNVGTGDRTFPSLKDKMNKEYSFKRESVAKLFRQAVKAGLELPECKRPGESKQTDDPNYCPYHRVLGHPIEDCYIFKNWLERKYRKGELTLSDNVLSHPRNESTRVVTSSSVPLDDERKDDKKPVQEEQWEIAVSKKTIKMLKQLEGVPSVKWKSPTEPVLNMKGLPKIHASTSKQHLSQASSSKPGKPKFFKNKTKLKKPKEKKTVTQNVIDSLDEYYQTVRQPIKLADFMYGLKIGEIEEDGDANPLPTEVCRVISVVPSMPVNEEYVKREAPEACMMVLPMNCSSEEDLYFPEENESDPDIASQMEHVNLGGLLGSFAPCVLFGSNAERLGSAPGSFIHNCFTYAGLYMLGNCSFGWNCLAPWLSYPSRSAIRRRFNLEGNLETLARSVGCHRILRDEARKEQLESMCDLAAHVFCHPCALCQEGRELRRRLPHPGFAARSPMVLKPPVEQTMGRETA
ncbi:hypothetical protein M5K25_018995 [Dendrobium thyrsiflorum]|uniref:Retrotransposon gag domain-containing protein n=1 Tax=Dendrobium thyrsiflorum TaxID=117978 RepID=A0ABD0UE03_DENTH